MYENKNYFYEIDSLTVFKHLNIRKIQLFCNKYKMFTQDFKQKIQVRDNNREQRMTTKMNNNITNSYWLSNENGTWPMFWRIFSSLCIPITIPWIIYKIIRAINYKRKFSFLSGKVVLITGASSGLGEALAHEFYSHGCKVVLAARRKEELERVKKDLLQMHPTVPTYPPVIVQMDLSELNSLPEAVSSVLTIFGHIDILINNGGISYRGAVNETNVDVDIKVMLVNYFGQVALTKAVLPMMLAKGKGHIVSVSSIQGRIGIPYRSAYAASKHALQAFCDTLRAEVANHGIKVTVVSPGYIQTKLSLNAITGSGQTYGVMDPTTAGGYTPEYVAKEVVKGLLDESPELIISQANSKFALYIRTLLPSLYFWIMAKRARKAEKKS